MRECSARHNEPGCPRASLNDQTKEVIKSFMSPSNGFAVLHGPEQPRSAKIGTNYLPDAPAVRS